MFVGGLNWDTTDGTVPLIAFPPYGRICVNFISLLFFAVSGFLLDGLRNYFSQFGKVDACTIMRDPAGRSRGFAFLTFEDPAAVNAVMVREHYLDGKIVGFFPVPLPPFFILHHPATPSLWAFDLACLPYALCTKANG